MTDLAGFLLARIQADEDGAHYAMSRGDGGALDYSGQWIGAVDHAERWEPARVLAECEAKRRILTDYRYYVAKIPEDFDQGTYIIGCLGALETVLQQFAAVYADHPDYREEWKP